MLTTRAKEAGGIILRVQNLSKKFCRRLSRSLWYAIRDLTDEMLLRSRNSAELRQDEFWALQDVSFELRQGETLGLIGRNGAGKSTLLRLINGLIKPDKGSISIQGRIGALIELGAGFNPVLTGRENIYVNAAVLGLRRKEVDRHLEEIIDFAELGDFIDAPLQSYSSGMRVRLGFSVAASLNPDLLLIDEILSVGDASFRERCVDRLANYKRNGGTIIFVSHNSAAAESISDRMILLECGRVVDIGEPTRLVQRYEEWALEASWQARLRLSRGEVSDNINDLRILDVQCCDMSGNPRSEFHFGEPFEVRVSYESTSDLPAPYFGVGIDAHRPGLLDATATAAQMLWDGIYLESLPRKGVVGCLFEAPCFLPGGYVIGIEVRSKGSGILGKKWYLRPQHRWSFHIVADDKVREVMPGVPGWEIYKLPSTFSCHTWKLNGHPLGPNHREDLEKSIKEVE